MERAGQRIGLGADGDLAFLHRLEHGGLGLGRRPVDFVGQHEVGEDGAREEHGAATAGVHVLLQNLRARDVAGHEVGRELDPAEGEVEGASEGAHEQGFGQAGDARDEGVAAREEGKEDVVDDVTLAHDRAAHLLDQCGATGSEPFNRLDVAAGDSGGGVAHCPAP